MTGNSPSTARIHQPGTEPEQPSISALLPETVTNSLAPMDIPQPLDSLFKEKLFRIPDYQRGYALASGTVESILGRSGEPP